MIQCCWMTESLAGSPFSNQPTCWAWQQNFFFVGIIRLAENIQTRWPSSKIFYRKSCIKVASYFYLLYWLLWIAAITRWQNKWQTIRNSIATLTLIGYGYTSPINFLRRPWASGAKLYIVQLSKMLIQRVLVSGWYWKCQQASRWVFCIPSTLET